MASTGDFIVQFQSITGTTVGEQRKKLFALLHQVLKNKLIIDLKQLQPKSSLEEKLKLEAMVYSNDIGGLFSELTSENPAVVHLIVKKASPLLVRALSGMTTDQLLHILSQISLNAKLKLLNKCGQLFDNSEKTEEFFKAIRDTYGMYLTTRLLTACSSEFIIDFLENNRCKLTSRQLLDIAKKHPKIVLQVLEILNKQVVLTNCYSSVFQYLAKHNVPLFINVHKIYGITFQIGWRSTNHFIKRDKTEIISNAKTYNEVLKNKYIRKSLHGEDFNQFYYNLFPPLINQFDNTYNQLLSLAPSLEVLLKGYRLIFNSDLLKEPKLIKPKLLEMMSNEERVKILKPEYKPEDFSDDQWTCYLSTAEATALLKKRIFLTSDIESRGTLLGLLVETCRINKDRGALIDLCNYMIKQHRNDHITVRAGFLKTVKKGFELADLDLEHWVPINELIQIFQLNGEEFYYIVEFLLGYLEFCIKHRIDFKEALITLLKRYSPWGSWNLFSEKPAYEKACLEAIPEILPKLGDDVTINSLAYINALMNWNKRHPKEAFIIHKSLNFVELLKEAIQKEDSWTLRYRDIIMWYVFKTKTMSERDTLLKLYISKMDENKIKWLIHNDLPFLLNNIDACVNTFLKNCVHTDSLWWHSKLYSHLEVPQKIINICSHTLAQELSENEKELKKNALTALSYLMPIADLLKTNYKIGPYMKNATPNLIVLETIILYCKSNRLPSTKRTISSIMNNLNEVNLYQLILALLEINNRHVRKVALFILFRTMQKDKIMSILQNFLADERNAILNKFILLKVFKYFIKNPSDYLWGIIQLSINTLDEDDHEAYNLIVQPTIVPEDYLVRYVLFMWPAVENLPNFYKDYGVKLLQVAKPNLLPQEFSEALIKKYFFCYSKNYPTFYVQLQAFVCKYICSNPTKIEDYVNKVVTVVLHNKADLKLRSYVSHFVRQLCYECIKQNRKDVLHKFAHLWNASLKPYESFYEYLYIQLSLTKIENTSLSEVANRLIHLCTSLTGTYGIEFLHPFLQQIKVFCMNNFVKGNTDEETEINLYAFVEDIVKSNKVVSLLLAIYLLENQQPSLIETKAKYEGLITTCKKRHEPEISMYLNDFINIDDNI